MSERMEKWEERRKREISRSKQRHRTDSSLSMRKRQKRQGERGREMRRATCEGGRKDRACVLLNRSREERRGGEGEEGRERDSDPRKSVGGGDEEATPFQWSSSRRRRTHVPRSPPLITVHSHLSCRRSAGTTLPPATPAPATWSWDANSCRKSSRLELCCREPGPRTPS